MYTRILTSAALLLVLSAPAWAQDNCSGEGAITCSFSPAIDSEPAVTTGVYEFGSNGRLVVQFDTVLTNFTLTVNADVVPLATVESNLDGKEFPTGTKCVQYDSQPATSCVQYDFTGTAVPGGPFGLPVKNKDYKGLITLTLSYFAFDVTSIHDPAFGHAPGDSTLFSENILTSYSVQDFPDPTMGGKTPGLSSVIALDEPLTETDFACNITKSVTNVPSGQKPEIEITFQLFNNSGCTGTPLRDKTASLSVSTSDSSGLVVFPALKNAEGNKFHWDSKNGLNEYDISTDGLTSGQSYTVTLFSAKFSPVSVTFLAP